MNPLCGANTAHGLCEQPAVDGGTRCYHHGGRSQLRRLRRKALEAEAENEEAAALADPERLMDLRRPVARNEVIVRRTMGLDVDEMAERAARRRIARDIGFDLIKEWRAQIDDVVREKEGEELAAAMREILEEFLAPTEGDLDLEVLAISERNQRIVSAHAKTQVDAAKALDWAKTQRELLLPILNELSMGFATLIRKWVGRHAPGDVTLAIDELGTLIRRTVGAMSETTKES